jgi:hypothetical protein
MQKIIYVASDVTDLCGWSGQCWRENGDRVYNNRPYRRCRDRVKT